MHDLAVVVIGRNEGERLVRCLTSAAASGSRLVYVDSNSTDDSVANAAKLGAQVISLDMSKPFSAARARNEGWRAALTQCPALKYIQFVDGDCEIEPGWLEAARLSMQANPTWSAVCGRRQELHPERSIYNAMCDLEWNTPVGEALAVGGDAMFRADILQKTKGYRDDVVAGEEPELCVRIRQLGGCIRRLDLPMTRHDANILTIGQWWTRAKRGGYAYALGAHLHGAAPELHWVRERRRALAWGLLMPLAFSLAAWATPWSLLGFAIYPAQWLRLTKQFRTRAATPRSFAMLMVLSKFAEAQGCIRWWGEHATGRSPHIIEYK
jgi:glycosyltransferase involved in cell wall biosynthesis